MSFQPWQKGSGTSADTTGKMNDILGNLQSSLDELAQRSNTMEKQITTPRFNPAKNTIVPDKISPFKFTKVTAPTVHFSGDKKHSSNVKRQDSANFPAPPPAEESFEPETLNFEPKVENHKKFDNRASFQAPSFPAPPPDVTPTEKFKINDIDNLLEDIEGLDLDSPLAGKQVGNAPTVDYSVPVNKYNSPSGLYAKNATDTINNTLNNLGFTKSTPNYTNNTRNDQNNTQNHQNYSDYGQNTQNAYENAPTEYTHPTTTKPTQKQEPAQKPTFQKPTNQEPTHQKPTGFNLYSDSSSSKRTPAEANAEVETAINRLKNLGQKLEPNQELTKLICFKCDLDIEREAATVLGQNFHPDCFTCSKCMQPLKTGVEFFVVGQNQPFCKSCYEDTLTSCFACDEKITQGRIVKALGHEYHPACFCCCDCSLNLDGKKFASDKDETGNPTSNSKPYCVNCYGAKFAPKCHRCKDSIIGGDATISRIVVGKDEYHQSCFTCFSNGCCKNLKEGAYPVKSVHGMQELYCHDHALEMQRASIRR